MIEYDQVEEARKRHAEIRDRQANDMKIHITLKDEATQELRRMSHSIKDSICRDRDYSRAAVWIATIALGLWFVSVLFNGVRSLF